jgi:hypothetical protein
VELLRAFTFFGIFHRVRVQEPGMKRAGKAIAVAVSTAGVAVALSWGGMVLRARIIEDRAIARLGSESAEERKAALRELAEVGSVRAIPKLLDLIEQEVAGRLRNPSAMVPAFDLVPFLQNALERIIELRGRIVVPVLIPLLGAEKPVVRETAANLLADLGPEASEAIPALEAAFRENPPVPNALMALSIDAESLRRASTGRWPRCVGGRLPPVGRRRRRLGRWGCTVRSARFARPQGVHENPAPAQDFT